jgi:hypothetical protein
MRDRCHTRGRRRRLSAALVAAATVLAAAPAGAQANAYVPPHHRVFHGVSDTGNADDFRTFRAQVGAHPAVLEDFYHWNTPLTTGALQRWSADIYSKYAGFAFPHLTSFYRHWKGRPFFIGEYSPWDADPGGLFVQRLFHWAKRHGRTRMLIYYRSVVAGSAFDIGHFPEARSELRRMLSRSRYAEYAPGTRHHGSG